MLRRFFDAAVEHIANRAADILAGSATSLYDLTAGSASEIAAEIDLADLARHCNTYDLAGSASEIAAEIDLADLATHIDSDDLAASVSGRVLEDISDHVIASRDIAHEIAGQFSIKEIAEQISIEDLAEQISAGGGIADIAEQISIADIQNNRVSSIPDAAMEALAARVAERLRLVGRVVVRSPA